MFGAGSGSGKKIFQITAEQLIIIEGFGAVRVGISKMLVSNVFR
jgi:hypothetical protein